MTTQLTTAAVQRLRPGKERREIRDGGCRGLVLIVQPSGHKSWAMRFRQRGRLMRMTLGPVDLTGADTAANAPIMGAPLSLASARRLAAEVNHQRVGGRDVIAAKRGEKVERDAKTFAQAARDFIEQHAMRKTRTWQEKARLLGLRAAGEELELISKGLADRWHDKPIADVSGDDIYAIVDEVRERGAPGLERRAEGPTEARAQTMLRTLSKLFAWLIQKRRLTQNPCAGVHRPETPKSRDRVLSESEIVKFWRAADVERNEFGALLKLLLLTGCRLNEVARMRRSELSDDGTTWTIPGARTKNRRAHVVSLAPMARAILASVHTSGDLVFTTNGTTPISGWSKIKGRLDARMRPAAPWRLHDVRRTVVTGIAELGIRGDVIELTVNHVSGHRGGIAGTYNRSELMPERRAALERWAAHVEGLIGGRRSANIVTFQMAGGMTC
jgi:integrase